MRRLDDQAQRVAVLGVAIVCSELLQRQARLALAGDMASLVAPQALAILGFHPWFKALGLVMADFVAVHADGLAILAQGKSFHPLAATQVGLALAAALAAALVEPSAFF